MPPETPIVPKLTGAGLPDLPGVLTSLPLRIEISQTILLVLVVLVGILVAAISVMLVYHWRRFPFEHALFRTSERVYTAGVILLLCAAAFGILIA